MPDAPKITPLGVDAINVEFGDEISLDLNDRAISFASHLDQNRFPGFIEAVPAYSSVAVFYDLVKVRRSFSEFPTAFDAVRTLIESALQNAVAAGRPDSRVVEIPTDFGGDSSPDLDIVAERSQLSPAGVIDLFTSKTYRVYMLGFLPGFAYMGEVDERIAIPRKDSPREKVAKGSVGIAGRQTGVYPLESPGGWQLIGRTDIELFTPDTLPPCLLRPGDEVRFVRRG